MPEPIGEHNIVQYLSAFADGELDAAQNVEVLRYLAAHLEAFAMMEQEQRLRMASYRAVREQTPPAPEQLKSRVRALAESGDSVNPDRPRRAPQRRVAMLVGIAVMSLIAGGLIARFAFPPTAPGTTRADRGAVAPVPVFLIDNATRIHVECSRFAAGVHTSEFPRSLGELAGSLRADIGGDKLYPDLSSIEYEMIGVGPCKKPLKDTVHLLYHSTKSDLDDTISIFVQPNTGLMAIEPGVAYLVTGPNSPHPMFVWRTEKVVYFLLGDDAETVRRVVELLHVPAKES